MRVHSLLALAALLTASCVPVHGSGVATGAKHEAHAGPVAIVALADPPGYLEVGLVQATGPVTIEQAADELREQARRLGGSVAKVDSIKSKAEMVTRTESYQYACGTPSHPQTCTGTRTVTSEVSTLTMIGRAFRKAEEAPR